MIKFDKLWETAKAKGVSNNALHEKYHISKAQLSRLRNNEGVTTCTVDRLCNLLECDISDIMEHIPDDNFFSLLRFQIWNLIACFFSCDNRKKVKKG